MVPSSSANGTPPKNLTPMILLIVGGVVGGALLLCVCGFGGWLLWLASLGVTPEKWDQRVREQAEERWKQEERQATSDQYRARAFIEYWLLLLDMKNLDEPYRLTSKAFQARMSRQQFEDFIKARPYLKEREHNWSHGVDGKPGDSFGFMLHSRDRNSNVFNMHINSTIWVEREAGDWRLDKIEDHKAR
jgi:hypothetical protein